MIDATHPYAQVVTANIRKACEKFPHICLLRCLRKESANMTENDRSGKNNIVHVKDTEEAVRYLWEKEGNILLTTGSKELALWQELPKHGERIFTRVLPVEASIRICRELGYAEGILLQCRSVFRRNELCAVKGISLFLHGNKRRGRYRAALKKRYRLQKLVPQQL